MDDRNGNHDDTDGGPELEEKLRRLFADDRLTLPVAVHAEDVVLAGAKRRRRRRASAAAAGGVLAAAVVAFAGVGLAGLGHSGGTVTAASPPALSVTTQATPAQTPTAGTTTAVAQLGPYGALGVFLGEPVDELVKISKTKGSPIIGTQKSADGCIEYAMLVQRGQLQPTPPAGSIGPTSVLPSGSTTGLATTPSTVFSTLPPAVTTSLADPGPSGGLLAKPGVLSIVVSPKSGVVQVGGVIELRTPEGVQPGVSVARLTQIYPKLAADSVRGELSAAAPGGKGSSYVFLLGSDHQVAELWLRSDAALDCRF